MATLYPPSIADLPGIPDSEKQVFERLKMLDSTYHVFHSVTWNDGRDGECDFVIFNEIKGFIALEVKGGRIDYDGYSWRSIDGSGNVNSIKNPAEQARGSMFAIKSIYERKYGGAMPGIYSWGVCFFDGNWRDAHNTLDLSGRNVIDIRGLEDPAGWIDGLFRESETRHGVKILSAGEKNSFLSLFNRSLSIPMSIRRVIEEQQKKLLITDRNQDYLLDLFEDKSRIAFQGAAGTGKTWIAMKKAERLASEGKKVLFLCYNRHLHDFIEGNIRRDDNISVMTFHAFALGVLKNFFKCEIEAHNCADGFFSLISEIVSAAGYPEGKERKQPSDRPLEQKINATLKLLSGLAPGSDCSSALNSCSDSVPSSIADAVSILLPTGPAVSADEFSSERLPLAVTYAFESGGGHPESHMYDAMIIDEGQDFHKNWCDTLKYIFNKYSSRIVYIFYDDNQTIFTVRDSLPVTDLIAESGLENHVFRLRDNLRNTREIHDFAVSRSGLGSTAKAADISGIKPEEVSISGGKNAAAYIGSVLDRVINENAVSQQQVIVLSNRSIENSVFAADNKAGGFLVVYSGEGKRAGSVRFRTIHQFKGLESDIVILLLHRREEEMKEQQRYLSDELLYVGFTRAKHLLYVVNVKP